MDNEYLQDEALVAEFVAESQELLQQLDSDLLALEKDCGQPGLVDRAFRALHTIKGTSGFLGLEPIVKVAHVAEDLLNGVRKGQRTMDGAAVAVLLRAADAIRAFIECVVQRKPLDADCSALIEDLRRCLGSETAATSGVQPVADGKPQPVTPADHASEPAAPAADAAPPNEERVAAANNVPSVASDPHAESGDRRSGNDRRSGGDDRRGNAQTVRVDVEKLDHLVNLVGELVLERNRLARLSRDLSNGQTDAAELETKLTSCASRLEFITSELQAASLKTRMVPLDQIFRRFPRVVHDLAHELGKDVELVISGAETELDKTMVEQISDPIVHLLRNSLDHGIESPERRTDAGKPARGTILLDARQEAEYIVITLQDDGAGLDAGRIGQKAVERGLLSEDRRTQLSNRELYDLIFLPGFSTAEKVSNVSGRGVGMDVVRTNLKKLNGTVELDSKPGQGCTVRLKLPLTMAILPVLLVEAAAETYAMPLRAVEQTVRIESDQIHTMDHQYVLRLRDCVLPVGFLTALVGRTSCSIKDQRLLRVVVMSSGDKRFGVIVDRFVGQEETIIKPLGNYLQQVDGVAGATVDGGGRVRLILDPAALAASLAASHQGQERVAC